MINKTLNKDQVKRLNRLIKTIDFLILHNYGLNAAITTCQRAFGLSGNEKAYLSNYYSEKVN